MSDKIETGIVAESISQPPAFGRLLRIFAPAAAIPIQSNDAVTVARQYRFWQQRVLITSIIGYATFYFVRKTSACRCRISSTASGSGKHTSGFS